jgi:hypothetical protein
MIATGNGGQQLTVAMAWTQPLPDAPVELRHVSFEPWIAWPNAPIVEPYLADFDRGTSFAIGHTPGDRFGLLMTSDYFSPSPPGMVFVREMAPYSPSIGVAAPIPEAAHDALFASLSDGLQLLGYARPTFNIESAMRIATPNGSSTSLSDPIALGCGGDTLVADAAARSPGWLVAASSAGALPDPCLIDGPAGRPATVGLARVALDGSVIPIAGVPAYPSDANVKALQVELAPRDSGFWLVHSAEVPGTPVFASRLDASGAPVVGPVAAADRVVRQRTEHRARSLRRAATAAGPHQRRRRPQRLPRWPPGHRGQPGQRLGGGRRDPRRRRAPRRPVAPRLPVTSRRRRRGWRARIRLA